MAILMDILYYIIKMKNLLVIYN